MLTPPQNHVFKLKKSLKFTEGQTREKGMINDEGDSQISTY